jgi:hypothetical protein
LGSWLRRHWREPLQHSLLARVRLCSVISATPCDLIETMRESLCLWKPMLWWRKHRLSASERLERAAKPNNVLEQTGDSVGLFPFPILVLVARCSAGALDLRGETQEDL